MGRIKSKMIKNTARQLLSKEHDFKADFECNKKIITGLMPSKPIRNKVAGYMARLIKQKQQKPVKQATSLAVDQSFSQEY